MPAPLGPYRSPPDGVVARVAADRRARRIGAGVAVVLGLGVTALVAPGVAFTVTAALLFYVVAPWFICRAPGR